MNRMSLLIVLAATAGFIGCVEADDEESTPDDTGQTGVELTVDVVGETDVAGFEFAVAPCADGDEFDESNVVHEKRNNLEDIVLPGKIPEFENSPFDEDSEHMFADKYLSLSPGCYDVEVRPITEAGEPSADCEVASAQDVVVEDQKTREILLVSQCDVRESGGMDVVAALNHAPEIENVNFEKFNQECDRVKVCATASDADGDPVEFEWTQLDGPELLESISRVEEKSTPCETDSCDFEEYDSYIRQDTEEVKSCVEMRLGEAGDYQFGFEVFDLYWDDGQLKRFENSSASFEFPVYGTTSEEECPPKDDNGEKLY